MAGITERPFDFRLDFFDLFASGVRWLPDDAFGPRFFAANGAITKPSRWHVDGSEKKERCRGEQIMSDLMNT